MSNGKQKGVDQDRWVKAAAHVIEQAFQGDRSALATLIACGPNHFMKVAEQQFTAHTDLQFSQRDYLDIFERLRQRCAMKMGRA